MSVSNKCEICAGLNGWHEAGCPEDPRNPEQRAEAERLAAWIRDDFRKHMAEVFSGKGKKLDVAAARAKLEEVAAELTGQLRSATGFFFNLTFDGPARLAEDFVQHASEGGIGLSAGLCHEAAPARPTEDERILAASLAFKEQYERNFLAMTKLWLVLKVGDLDCDEPTTVLLATFDEQAARTRAQAEVDALATKADYGQRPLRPCTGEWCATTCIAWDGKLVDSGFYGDIQLHAAEVRP